MTSRVRNVRSHLFTLRVWPEEVDQDHTEWRGKVQHVLDGETHYFHDWATLVESLVAMLSDWETSRPEDGYGS